MSARDAARRGAFAGGVVARIPAALVLATWLVAGCDTRADLGGTAERDAGPSGAGATGRGTGGVGSGGSGAGGTTSTALG
jgi:hypothetical protein